MVKKSDTESEARRNVFALGFVSFFTDISSEMCFSLLPTFILGLPGSSRAMLGLIEGVAEALSYGLRAISGVFSDKFRKRKAVILVGYSLSNVVKPLFATAQSALDAFVIRVADRVGKGVRTAPRDALLSETVSDKRRGAAFGLHRTLDQTGGHIRSVDSLCIHTSARLDCERYLLVILHTWVDGDSHTSTPRSGTDQQNHRRI